MAGRLHGASRLTFDLDLLARRDVENLDRVAAVLRELGAFLRVDVLSNLKDAVGQPVDFEELAARGTTSTLEGVGVRLVSLPDLITAKRFADRAKDHDALPELERLRDSQSHPPSDPPEV